MMPSDACVPGCPVQPIMKINLLVNLIERTQRGLGNKAPRIAEGRRKAVSKVIVASPERIQLHQAKTPCEALNTLGHPSSVDLLLLGVFRSPQQILLSR